MTDFDAGGDPFGIEMPESASRLRGGRYYFPEPGEEDAGDRAHTRMTNRVKALADNFALERWNIQKVLEGIALDESLYMKLIAIPDLTSKDGKAELNEIAALAKERAGGNTGARMGTAYHGMTENLDHGNEASRRIPARYQPKMVAYREALKRARLAVVPDYIERRVRVNHELIGTLDRILMCEVTGKLYIGDLKSQAKFWSYTEIAPQLAGYANATHAWDEVTQSWEEMPEVDKELAVVIWMPHTHPSGNDEVEIHAVRIERAWNVAVPLAGQVKDWQRESQSLAFPWSPPSVL